MTNYTDKIETARQAMIDASNAEDTDTFHAAFNELQAAEEERDRARREAVERGLDANLNALERAAMARSVLRAVDILEDQYAEKPDLDTEEGRLYRGCGAGRVGCLRERVECRSGLRI